MNKEEFDTIFGQDSAEKEQYRDFFISVLDWALKASYSLTTLEEFGGCFQEAYEALGPEVTVSGFQQLSNIIHNDFIDLMDNIIKKHSNEVFVGGLDMQKYIANNLMTHMPDIYKEVFNEEDE